MAPHRASPVRHYQTFIGCAVVAAHAQFLERGFRHRDVHFLIELFSNWSEAALDQGVLEIQNVQIARYVRQLVDEGYARQLSKKGNPHYELTRIGLIQIISTLVSNHYLDRKSQFFFLYYFVKNYRPLLMALVKRQGQQFPPALQIELDDLLDSKKLLTRELEHAQRELKKVMTRAQNAKQAHRYIKQLIKEGQDFPSAVQELERFHPYELNSQKTLRELIGSLPTQVRLWELTVGNELRAADIWMPHRRILESYVKAIEELLAHQLELEPYPWHY
ncbi:MAG: hypothetical protein KDD62_04470 [Bdellovibrionales bacterium]|nr:hypothetical protein [Bdellovibrionales bacterium]